MRVSCTVWKVSKYGVSSVPYFPVFRLNTEIYRENLLIQPDRIQENTDQKKLRIWTLFTQCCLKCVTHAQCGWFHIYALLTLQILTLYQADILCLIETQLLSWVNIVETPYRSNRPEVFYKKSVFRKFAKFRGKYLCQSLFFNKVADLREP